MSRSPNSSSWSRAPLDPPNQHFEAKWLASDAGSYLGELQTKGKIFYKTYRNGGQPAPAALSRLLKNSVDRVFDAKERQFSGSLVELMKTLGVRS
ncbi:hypothetical protein [Paracoccus sp. PARArs4]|uniref:hypothetical protein n=1 Tax=Paracoccus sp. PARArs4 TaxID=2853442 RepID=UPI0024A6DAA8|nr:hypothetical protein [Paracoccus sp. PARArs4]